MFEDQLRQVRVLRGLSTRVRPLRLAYVLWSAAAITSGQGKIPGSSPTIPVALDGVSGPFLIDTGAERSVVDPGLAGRLAGHIIK